MSSINKSNPLPNSSLPQVQRGRSTTPRSASKTPPMSRRQTLTRSESSDSIEREDAPVTGAKALGPVAKNAEAMHKDLEELKANPNLKKAFLAKKIAPIVMGLTGFVTFVLLCTMPHLAVVPGLLFGLSIAAETLSATYIRRQTKQVAPEFSSHYTFNKEALTEEKAALATKIGNGTANEADKAAFKAVSEVIEHGEYLTNDYALPVTFGAIVQAKELAMTMLKKARGTAQSSEPAVTDKPAA